MDPESSLPDAVRKSYLRKFGALTLVVLVVVSSVGLYTISAVSTEVRSDAQTEVETSAAMEADRLSEWLEEDSEFAKSLSNIPEIQSYDRGEIISSQLRRRLNQERVDAGARAIHLVETDSGTIEVSTNTDLEGESFDDPELQWASGEMGSGSAAEVAVTDVYEEGGQSTVAFVSTVRNTPYSIAVVVNADRYAGEFADRIPGSYTTVVSESGAHQFTSAEEGTDAALDGDSGIADRLADEDRGVAEIERNGDTELVGYVDVSGADWVLAYRVPTDVAYSVVGEVQTYIAVLVGATVVGFLLVGATIGRSTVLNLRELSAKATAIADGDLDGSIEGSDRIDEIGAVNDAFADIDDYVTLVADQADALAEQRFDDRVLDEEVPGALGRSLDRMQRDLQAALSEAEELAATLERQAEQFGQTMERAAAGDLTRRLDPEVDNEAMRRIADASNEMLAELETTVERVQAFAREVDTSSDSITASVEEVERASQEVSESVQEIAAGADRQDDSIQTASGEMTDLSAAIEEVASSADEVAEIADRAAETGERGSRHAVEALDELDEIESTAETAIEEVERLTEEMAEIVDIVDLIDDIAEQTNVLALNASIEAARAGQESGGGDVGEGFGVVADEVKQLAEETREATEEIERRIGAVQSSTEATADDMREMGRRVDDGIDTVGDAIGALEEIVEQVREVNDGVQSISEATDDQASSTEEVVAMMEDVGDVSEETTGTAEDVAAVAEEQAASTSEVADSVSGLSDRANDLRDLMEQFDTAGDLDATDPADGDAEAVATDGAGDGVDAETDDEEAAEEPADGGTDVASEASPAEATVDEEAAAEESVEETEPEEPPAEESIDGTADDAVGGTVEGGDGTDESTGSGFDFGL